MIKCFSHPGDAKQNQQSDLESTGKCCREKTTPDAVIMVLSTVLLGSGAQYNMTPKSSSGMVISSVVTKLPPSVLPVPVANTILAAACDANSKNPNVEGSVSRNLTCKAGSFLAVTSGSPKAVSSMVSM